MMVAVRMAGFGGGAAEPPLVRNSVADVDRLRFGEGHAMLLAQRRLPAAGRPSKPPASSSIHRETIRETMARACSRDTIRETMARATQGHGFANHKTAH